MPRCYIITSRDLLLVPMILGTYGGCQFKLRTNSLASTKLSIYIYILIALLEMGDCLLLFMKPSSRSQTNAGYHRILVLVSRHLVWS